MKKKFLKLSLICILSLGIGFYAKAQGPGDPGGPNGDPEVPLDPGSWVLAAAGVGYGVKKWRDAKQQSRKDVTVEIIDTKEKQENSY
jgi:hypothetical protein